MSRSVRHIARQLLIGLLALQMLNISIGSANVQETDYDYSYSYNKTYDPTESAVEFFVELEYGQQSGFSYSNHTTNHKSLIKVFHWKTTLQETVLSGNIRPAARAPYPVTPAVGVLSRALDILAPPPKA